jgi:nucleoside 2-deoxyribosyltransferase
MVYSRGSQPTEIPPYRSNSVFKIGSGDVFSAAFALYWGERGLDAARAADYASRSVARFVDGHSLPLGEAEQDGQCEPVDVPSSGKIYLAGPFFDLAQRWLIEETLRTLKSLGADVFSPLHDVGTGPSSAEIAQADLEGLRNCSKVLALLDGVDPGTVYEVGYARALDIPVVALAERVDPEHLTMIVGSGCDVVNDFATAIYRILWTRGR